MIRSRHHIEHGYKFPLGQAYRSSERYAFFVNKVERRSLLANLILYADTER